MIRKFHELEAEAAATNPPELPPVSPLPAPEAAATSPPALPLVSPLPPPPHDRSVVWINQAEAAATNPPAPVSPLPAPEAAATGPLSPSVSPLFPPPRDRSVVWTTIKVDVEGLAGQTKDWTWNSLKVFHTPVQTSYFRTNQVTQIIPKDDQIVGFDTTNGVIDVKKEKINTESENYATNPQREFSMKINIPRKTDYCLLAYNQKDGAVQWLLQENGLLKILFSGYKQGLEKDPDRKFNYRWWLCHQAQLKPRKNMELDTPCYQNTKTLVINNAMHMPIIKLLFIPCKAAFFIKKRKHLTWNYYSRTLVLHEIDLNNFVRYSIWSDEDSQLLAAHKVYVPYSFTEIFAKQVSYLDFKRRIKNQTIVSKHDNVSQIKGAEQILKYLVWLPRWSYSSRSSHTFSLVRTGCCTSP